MASRLWAGEAPPRMLIRCWGDFAIEGAAGYQVEVEPVAGGTPWEGLVPGPRFMLAGFATPPAGEAYLLRVSAFAGEDLDAYALASLRGYRLLPTDLSYQRSTRTVPWSR